jgi:3-oxoacyl-[acyl-carrier-protein] synthase III
MKWKLIDIQTWNPGLAIDNERCRSLFGDQVADLKGPKTRYFYDGEDLQDLTKRHFSKFISTYDIPETAIKDLVVGYTFLPQEWMNRKPGLDCLVANELNLTSCEPSYMTNRVCSTIPQVFEYLDNKRFSGRRTAGDVALVAIMDFPSIFLRRPLDHHAISKVIFGDGVNFMLLVLVDDDDAFAPGYTIEDVASLFIPGTADKACSDHDGAIHLSRYMTDDVPELIWRNGIEPLLRKHQLTVSDFRYWAIHPGGIPIIAGVEKKLGLDKRTLQYVYDTFFDGGNRYAVSAGYVFDRIHRLLPKSHGDRIFWATAAIGIYLGACIMTYRNARV